MIVLQVVGIARLLPPRALDRVAVDVGVVDGHDGVGSGLLRRKPAQRNVGFLKREIKLKGLFLLSKLGAKLQRPN